MSDLSNSNPDGQMARCAEKKNIPYFCFHVPEHKYLLVIVLIWNLSIVCECDKCKEWVNHKCLVILLYVVLRSGTYTYSFQCNCIENNIEWIKLISFARRFDAKKKTVSNICSKNIFSVDVFCPKKMYMYMYNCTWLFCCRYLCELWIQTFPF